MKLLVKAGKLKLGITHNRKICLKDKMQTILNLHEMDANMKFPSPTNKTLATDTIFKSKGRRISQTKTTLSYQNRHCLLQNSTTSFLQISKFTMTPKLETSINLHSLIQVICTLVNRGNLRKSKNSKTRLLGYTSRLSVAV